MSKVGSFFEKNYKLIIVLFFLVFFLIGIFIYKDYGISWDESNTREKGYTSIKYVFEGNDDLLTDPLRVYGPAFDMFAVAVEKTFNLKDPMQIYQTRHLTYFLLFFLSIIFFYFLSKKVFKSWKIGIVGSLFLILSPRIFAHSFYNPKDLPFMSVFIISLYTAVLFLENKTLIHAFVHGLVCGILIDIRIMGIIIPFFTIIFFILDLVIKKEIKGHRKKIIWSILLFIFTLIFFTILLWPYLWGDPIGRFIESFKVMSKYPWDGFNLYMGEYAWAANVPWHYIPVWLIITTPILYTVFFVAGFFVIIKNFIVNPFKYYLKKKENLIFLLCFIIPLATVIIFKSVLYNEWRQMYFIYPPFLLISLGGMVSLYNFFKSRLKFRNSVSTIKIILTLLLICSLANTSYFMVNNHPYQGFYFNVLAGKDMAEAKYNFDIDTLGTPFKQALEYILKNDSRKNIIISYVNKPVYLNAAILPAEERKKLVFKEILKDSDYFITDYRYHRLEYSFPDEVYSIKINGVKITSVYKLK
jgi:hypothetical protein